MPECPAAAAAMLRPHKMLWLFVLLSTGVGGAVRGGPQAAAPAPPSVDVLTERPLPLWPGGVITKEHRDAARRSPASTFLQQFDDYYHRAYDTRVMRHLRGFGVAENTSLLYWSREYEYVFHFSAIHRFLPDNGTVFDLGCGVNFFMWALARSVPSVRLHGLDNNPAFQAVLEDVAQMEGAAFTFKLADLERPLPAPSSSADVVYCVSVLEHMSEPMPLVREVDRVLRPGGVFVVTFDVLTSKKAASLRKLFHTTVALAMQLLQRLDSVFERVVPSSQGAMKKADFYRPGLLHPRDGPSTTPEYMKAFPLVVYCGVWRKRQAVPGTAT
uniref:Methyltransferase type 11 domain-containing protein n=1 Tax=Eutreptiella gymnastica TaxID=73025 RepID=A0A7S4GHZ8_9EUGL